MYHHGCSITETKEQKTAFQRAFDALSSIPTSNDLTDRLFIYPITAEYTVSRSLVSRTSSHCSCLIHRSPWRLCMPMISPLLSSVWMNADKNWPLPQRSIRCEAIVPRRPSKSVIRCIQHNSAAFCSNFTITMKLSNSWRRFK